MIAQKVILNHEKNKYKTLFEIIKKKEKHKINS